MANGMRWLLVILLGAAVIAPQGQQVSLPGRESIPSQMGTRSQGPFGGMPDYEDIAFIQKQMNALNAARQKALVSDADKLLKLAQELNTEIESANSASLSSDQLKKISNIEKLARNVKQRMSESITTGPSLHDPLAPIR